MRLGYEFNIASRAFNAIGVDTNDLGNVPELLRGILEETLSQEASQASSLQTRPYRAALLSRRLSLLRIQQTMPCPRRPTLRDPTTLSTSLHLHPHRNRKMRWQHCKEVVSLNAGLHADFQHTRSRSILEQMAFHFHQCRIRPYRIGDGMYANP